MPHKAPVQAGCMNTRLAPAPEPAWAGHGHPPLLAPGHSTTAAQRLRGLIRPAGALNPHPRRILSLFLHSGCAHLLEHAVGPLEQVWVHLVGGQHPAGQLLGEEHVAVHGGRRDLGNLQCGQRRGGSLEGHAASASVQPSLRTQRSQAGQACTGVQQRNQTSQTTTQCNMKACRVAAATNALSAAAAAAPLPTKTRGRRSPCSCRSSCCATAAPWSPCRIARSTLHGAGGEGQQQVGRTACGGSGSGGGSNGGRQQQHSESWGLRGAPTFELLLVEAVG